MKKQRISILSSQLDQGSFDDFVSEIVAKGLAQRSNYTCCVNVHMLIEAYRNPEFQSLINQADRNAPDGKPLAMLMSRLAGRKQVRVAGMDLLPAILARAEQAQARVFFMGDTEGVLAELTARVNTDFPELAIAGTLSPPFRVLAQAEAAELCQQINDTRPNILFVALGCPKQERWMAQHKGQIPASMIGVGNAFRAYLGHEKRAPKWMQNASLEWMYRLIQNPKRLWKRYLLTNTMFLWLLSKEFFFSHTESQKTNPIV